MTSSVLRAALNRRIIRRFEKKILIFENRTVFFSGFFAVYESAFLKFPMSNIELERSIILSVWVLDLQERGLVGLGLNCFSGTI